MRPSNPAAARRRNDFGRLCIRRCQSIHSTFRQTVDKYLERIGLSKVGVAADLASLRSLQRRHLLSVPFENLDIHWGRQIILDTAAFYKKIVEEGRGGFCYELNGLFNELLRYLGFETRLISARVATQDGGYGPEFDHAAIIVTIGDDTYLADVGFGDFTVEPLKFVLDEVQDDPAGKFLISRGEDEYLQVSKVEADGRKSEYIFTERPRMLSEFTGMCDHQQYSPESHFTKGKVCSILTEEGRKTLTDTKFIITENGRKTEFAVNTASEFYNTLEREFGIVDREAIAA